ncbi:MAG: nitrate reductase cytochrome c-type subunit [Candidatus Sulfomarinibacteraceae bacterium]
MKNTILVLSLVIVLGCSSSGPETTEATSAAEPAPATESVTTIPETEIGLAPGTVFEQPEQQAIGFNAVDPGDSEIQPRPNAEFPPVIPHSVQDLGPITLTENPCLECHGAEVAEDMGAVAVPASHTMDLRNAPGEFGERVTGARLVCTSCHVETTK